MANYPTTTTTPNTTDIVLTNGGCAGIGVTAMSYPLQVQKDGSVTDVENIALLTNFPSNATSVGSGASILFGGKVPTGASGAGTLKSLGIIKTSWENTSGGSKMEFVTRDDSASSGDTSTKMTILSGGNVGIGTAAPGQKLDVAGNINASGSVQVGAMERVNANAGMLAWDSGTFDGI